MRRFLFTLLMVVPAFGFTQANYHKGYVVTNSNDTLRGYVDFKERSNNPLAVNFKSDLSGPMRKFTLSDAAAYGLDGLEYFQRFVVDISMSATDVANLSVGPDSSAKRDTVFLKVLQLGKNLNLYGYVDDLKERFYIMPAGRPEPVELIRNLYLKAEGKNTIIGDDKYTRQLLVQMKRFYPDDLGMEKALWRLAYKEQALLKVVSLINEQQPLKSKYKGSRFFVGAGFSGSTAAYAGQHVLASAQASSKTSYLPFLAAGIDLFVKPSIGRAIFRTELSVSMSSNEIALPALEKGSTEIHHSFDQVSAVITPQFLYHIYHTDKLKCFAGLGGGLNFSSTRNNKTVYLNEDINKSGTVEDEIVPEKFNYSLQLMAGVVLHKKIEIAAGYSPNVAISNYKYFNVIMHRFRFGLNYLLGIH